MWIGSLSEAVFSSAAYISFKAVAMLKTAQYCRMFATSAEPLIRKSPRPKQAILRMWIHDFAAVEIVARRCFRAVLWAHRT